MGLFRLYGRAELSWEEIGKIGLKSAKNFGCFAMKMVLA